MEGLNLIRKFGRHKVLVVGDLMLDRYLIGAVNRISPEAPVPIVDIQQEDCRLGGAGNVAANIIALGAESCALVGAIGTDLDGEVLCRLMSKTPRLMPEIITLGVHFPTTVKTRIVAGTQQLVRVDQGRICDLMPEQIVSLLSKIESYIKAQEITAVILSDYGKGFVSQRLVNGLFKLKQKYGFLLSVDPKNNALKFKGITLVTPNLKEAYSAAGMPYKPLEGHSDAILKVLDVVAKKLHKKWNPEYLAIKLGANGIHVSWDSGDGSVIRPTGNVPLADVCGAGDTVIAAMTLAMLSGASILSAAEVGNKAAGIVVGKFGTATCNWMELRDVILNRD